MNERSSMKSYRCFQICFIKAIGLEKAIMLELIIKGTFIVNLINYSSRLLYIVSIFPLAVHSVAQTSIQYLMAAESSCSFSSGSLQCWKVQSHNNGDGEPLPGRRGRARRRRSGGRARHYTFEWL